MHGEGADLGVGDSFVVEKLHLRTPPIPFCISPDRVSPRPNRFGGALRVICTLCNASPAKFKHDFVRRRLICGHFQIASALIQPIYFALAGD
ncbi:hypothetical protein D3C87_1716480 [compost metagenome]